jgi:cyclopropane fatty-acyl-phospholipid synthase-like methyltransferase
MKEHWDNVYASKEVDKLGWYEEAPAPSIKLLSHCNISKDGPILDIGSGSTTLIDYLIKQRHKSIIAVDISAIALNKLKQRLGKEKASLIKWIIDDIIQPVQVQELRDIAIWHDRALLHFLFEDSQREMYLSTLKKVVKKGGYVIMAVFSLKGAKKCSGLSIKNYDQNMLAEFLGEGFKLLEYFDYKYYMPSGDSRPYIYTLFQREE